MPWGSASLSSALSKLSAATRSIRSSKKGGDPIAQWEPEPPPPLANEGGPHAAPPSDAHPAAAFDPQPQNGWRIPEKYELGQVLGTGAYGNVHEARDTEDGRYVAIKRIKYLFNDAVDCKRVLREIAILARLDNENIVRILEIPIPRDWQTFNEIYIIMGVCDTDLKKLMKKDATLSFLHIGTIFYKILLGLNYLHSAQVYHRDLKPANCLVNQDCSVKICDFGLARAVGDDLLVDRKSQLGESEPGRRRKKRCLTSHVVTRWYRAPELILGQDNYTQAVDMWSAGCIFAELLGMLEGAKREDRGPLFKGASCVLLSPKAGGDESDPLFSPDMITNDQLAIIVSTLGTPDTKEMHDFLHEEAKRYIECLPHCEGTGLRGGKFEHVDAACMDLMEGLLRFGATRRMRVDEALAHEVFVREVDGMVIRDPSQEQTAEEPIYLPFEKEPLLDEAVLRLHFKQELQQIKSMTHA